MVDPLSVAASAFAVVGVIDVVLRASIEFCRFLSEIKDAPKEVEQLRNNINGTIHLLNASKKCLEDLQNNTFPTDSSSIDVTDTIEQFRVAIRSLDRELKPLVALTKKPNLADRSWARVKWVLNERKVEKSLQKLEYSKSTLTNALVLVGWCVDVSSVYFVK
jgi:hypothetical protein